MIKKGIHDMLMIFNDFQHMYVENHEHNILDARKVMRIPMALNTVGPKLSCCGIHNVDTQNLVIHYLYTCTQALLRSREYRFTHMCIVDIPFLSEALSGERI